MAVLSLELIISTAIKSYDSQRVSIRQLRQNNKTNSNVNNNISSNRLFARSTSNSPLQSQSSLSVMNMNTYSNRKSPFQRPVMPIDISAITLPQSPPTTSSRFAFAPDSSQPDLSGKYAMQSNHTFNNSAIQSPERYNLPLYNRRPNSTDNGDANYCLDSSNLNSATSLLQSSMSFLSTSLSPSKQQQKDQEVAPLLAHISSKNTETRKRYDGMNEVEEDKQYVDI